MSRQGSLRASDADRDAIVDRLHKAATEGRIAAEELEQRVSQALRARTYAELEATVADLPTPRDLARNGQRRSPTAGGVVLTTLRRYPLLILVAIPLLAVTAAVMVAALVLWLTVMMIVFLVGGRRLYRRGPWTYYSRGPWTFYNTGAPYTRSARRSGPPPGRGGRRYGPPGGRGGRSYWA